MSLSGYRASNLLLWLLPFAVLAVLLGYETNWGRELKHLPPENTTVAAQPVTATLLPEYRLDAADARRETVERTLFNPTRRPAPVAQVVAAKPAIQRGKFVLTGTLVVDQKATAFLREVSGGRARRVQQGETLDGMLVAEVRPDRVRLTLGDDAEELSLKVAAGPRTTIQPAVPQPVAAVGGVPQPATGQPLMPGAVPAGSAAGETGDTLAARRRAARAADAAAAQQQANGAAAPAVAAPTPVAPPAQRTGAPGNAPDPAWNAVYQRYMQQQR